MVYQGGTAVSPGGHGADPTALRPPAPARSGLYRGRRPAQAGVRQDQYAADAPAGGVRTHRGRAPSLALDRRRAEHGHPSLLHTGAPRRRLVSPRILIVDDEAPLRRTLERALKAIGY